MAWGLVGEHLPRRPWVEASPAPHKKQPPESQPPASNLGLGGEA